MQTSNDGLFENPNAEADQAQHQQETLNQIQDDTSTIRQTLEKFGGNLIDKMTHAEKAQSQQFVQQKKTDKAVIKAIEQGVLLNEHQREKNATPKQRTPSLNNKHSDNTQSDYRQSPTLPSPKPQQAENKEKSQPKSKSRASEKETDKSLPNGWKRDENGYIRDKKGKFVSPAELKKHNLQNPEKKKEENTEDLAKERNLLDALEGIKEAVGSPDNLDPLIDSVKEVTSPLGTVFDGVQKVSEVTGRGFGKLFGGDQREQRWRDRFFARWKKADKREEKHRKLNIDWLKQIWKKNDGKGGGLFSMLMRLPLLLMRLPFLLLSVFGKGLLGLFSKSGKSLFGGFGKLFSGFGKFFKSMPFGKLGGGLLKGGKGLLKRIPILGSLLSIFDIAGGLADDSRDENGKSNRGKRVGSGVGALVGGALGSLLGPIGTMAGMLIGDIVGEKIGAWLADLNWKDVGEGIKNAWTTSVNFVGDLWNGATQFVKDAWGAFKASEIGTAITGVWDNAVNKLTEYWNSFKASDIVKAVTDGWDKFVEWLKNLIPDWIKDGATTVANLAGNAVEKGKEIAVKAVEQGKEWGAKAVEKGSEMLSAAGDVVGSAAGKAWDWLTNWGEHSNPPTLQEENASQQVSESIQEIEDGQTKTRTFLDLIHNVLLDIHQTLRDILDRTNQGVAFNGLNPDGSPISTGTANIQYGTVGAGVDPKTGKQIRYTNAPFLGGTIDGLTQEETAKAMNALSARESGGNFSSENYAGYIGGYQFGADALSSLGYVDKEKWQKFRAGKDVYSGGKHNNLHAQFLNDPSNWKIAGGKNAFLNSKQMQDEAAVKLMNSNLNVIKKSGVVLNSAEDIAGAGFAAHLKGAGSAIKLLKNGQDSKDGLGTSAAYYYQYGSNAVKTNVTPSQKATIEQDTALSSQGMGIASATKNVTAIDAHTPVPVFDQPKDNSEKLRKQVESQMPAKAPTALSANNTTEKDKPTNAVDPVLQFLTQDVSERRIAHIVTGGIALRGRN